MSEQGTNQIQQLQVPPAQDFDTANFQGSMQEVLHENIGKYVLVDFLIGTSNLVTRQGFLYYVGTQFIVLYDSLNLRYVVCEIFSIKFVTFLLPGYQPGQIQTPAEFEMHPGTPNTQVVSEMTQASEGTSDSTARDADAVESFAARPAMTPAQAALAHAIRRKNPTVR